MWLMAECFVADRSLRGDGPARPGGEVEATRALRADAAAADRPLDTTQVQTGVTGHRFNTLNRKN